MPSPRAFSFAMSSGGTLLGAQDRVTPRPQLILLDVMMPVMNGAEFRSAQQQAPQLAGIPVVVMSAAENDEAQAPLPTADAYLPKPIDFDALLTQVEQYCSESREQGR